MSINMQLLTPQLRTLIPSLQQLCANAGWPLLIYCGGRTAREQAILYRRSRTMAEIERKADQLRGKGYSALAELLLNVGPQQGTLGKHVTHAGPGESWHQYGEAIDAVPMLHGKPQWDADCEGWEVYGDACDRFHLSWAGYWTSFKEYPHAQVRPGGNPLNILSPDEVKNTLLWR